MNDVHPYLHIYFNVTFRLVVHNCETCRAELSETISSQILHVDTRLLEPFDEPTGSLVTFIGEMDCLAEDCDQILKARVVRCMDRVDLNLYYKALQVQRDYLKSRTHATNNTVINKS